ncbi:MAG: CRISPR-associated endonuclease Cas1 [Pirellulales bacterium]|nr:CRISPR-associated endonuclease Cas1 [Pirellulales bacterium]
MWVQGEFADNLDTHEGRFGHRRVDQPSRQAIPDPGERGEGRAVRGEGKVESGEGDASAESRPALSPVPGEGDASTELPPDVEPIHSRSVMLSAPLEGLIAKIDVLDITAGIASPVDYKRGRLPDVPGNAWEPEQVQLCTQGLILRENGYLCEGGFLYYIESKRKVSIPFDEPLVARTRELLAGMKSMAAGGAIPPPLEDSPKCPRCSLVGICLPDETRLLTQKESEPPEGKTANKQPLGEVRRLMPARDDALPLYVKDQGVTLGKSGDVLTVKSRQETLQKVKLIDVSQVSVFGNVQITAQALREISSLGIPICHFSYGGWFNAMTVGMTHKNIELRMRQFAVAADARQSLELARRFVVGKIKNSRTLLRRHLPEDDRAEIDQLARLVPKAEAAENAGSLLGVEGMAAKTYFAGFARLLKGDQAFYVEGRNRRPPRDPVNAMLSFVYALLVKEWTIALHAAGFDVMLGFYHRPRYGRPSLPLDLAEEFRPLVADSTVLMLVNNGEVAAKDFICRAGAVALTDAGRRAVIASFERRMDTLVTHPIFGYRVSYRRIFEVQARLLGRVLLGEIGEYPSFCTR